MLSGFEPWHGVIHINFLYVTSAESQGQGYSLCRPYIRGLMVLHSMCYDELECCVRSLHQRRYTPGLLLTKLMNLLL